MAQVRIKGLRNTSVLAKGEERTVERTVQVDRLIANGHAKELYSGKREPELVVPDEGPEDYDVSVPPHSATKTEWIEFLESQGVHPSEESTKAELIESWETRGDA